MEEIPYMILYTYLERDLTDIYNVFTIHMLFMYY